MRRRHLSCVPVLLLIFYTSCKKSTFLDAKPDISVAIPTNIADCQALLDNDVVMNGYSLSGYPSLGETGSDDFYVTTPLFLQYTPTDQHAVVWAKDIYVDDEVNDWDLPYRTVLYANVAIGALNRLNPLPEDQESWNNAYGSAYFFRAFAYYTLAQIFTPVYDSSSAGSDLGLPLRKGTDVNEKFSRVSVQQTYDQVIADVSTAIQYLPDSSLSVTRPSKAAAYGLMARVYLSARNYSAALLYADSCLRIKQVLLDYNTVDPGNILPFTRTNPEVLFGAANFSTGASMVGRSFTDSVLLRTYQTGDLRKTLFFKGGRFFGVYDEDGFAFCGLATDEMYLTRAECYARAGNTTAAMDDLNSLLVNRWVTGSFIPFTATDAGDALQQILMERRKELLYRGLRWTDLRRLNKEPARAVTLTRMISNAIYTLPPNDPRYVYPIPPKVLTFNMGMKDNDR